MGTYLMEVCHKLFEETDENLGDFLYRNEPTCKILHAMKKGQ